MQQWLLEEDAKSSERNFYQDTANFSYEGSRPQRQWLFRVQTFELRPEEVICVSGNVSELGNWIPEKSVPLQCEDEDTNIWSGIVKIPDNQRVEYRYCVCVIVESEIQVIVRNWETNIQPRLIKPHQNAFTNDKSPQVYGNYDGQVRIEKGWLTKGAIVQLKIYKKLFTLWRPRYINRTVKVKVTPVNLLHHTHNLPKSVSEALDESLSTDTQDNIDIPRHSSIEVCSLKGENDTFQLQGQFGETINENDMLIFQSYVLFPSTTAFLLDLYVYSSRSGDNEPPRHVGFCYLLPSALEGSEGGVVLPLTSTKHRPLGELKLDYLVIHPLPNFKCDMKVSYARHWKKTRQGLDVGHRGSGSSFKVETKDCAEIRENTIASLKTAINHGADFVEFDVQLSKDFVPIIYHDFHVCISMKRKRELTESDMLELPLKELTLDQLRLLKVYHLTEGKTKNPRFFDDDLEEHQPFPTLQSALELLDSQGGFNIEVKWNMKLMDGSYELNDPLELNLYLDTILEVVLNYGGQRRIVFSSFNPDVCSMIRYKQNKYPVMFLTQGDTTKYPHYDDPRCWSIKSGVQFVTMIEILGLNAHTEDILRDPSLVKLATSAEIVLFCWGDENSDPATIKYLKSLGLHGIIYDKIYQYISKDVKDNIYLLEGKESDNELIRIAAANSEIPQSPQRTPVLGLRRKTTELEAPWQGDVSVSSSSDETQENGNTN